MVIILFSFFSSSLSSLCSLMCRVHVNRYIILYVLFLLNLLEGLMLLILTILCIVTIIMDYEHGYLRVRVQSPESTRVAECNKEEEPLHYIRVDTS